MEDERIWEFERGLWIGGEDRYRELIDDECVMVLPAPPFVMSGEEAIASVSDTPRWEEVDFDRQQVMRPQEGLIVIAYAVRARREGRQEYQAYCTSTLRRLAHEEWRVVQHQQTLPPAASG